METQHLETRGSDASAQPSAGGRMLWGLLIGLALGVGLAAAGGWLLMPRLMLNVHRSKFSFDDTVQRVQNAVKRQGWVVTGTRDMQESLAKHGRHLGRRVKIVELCHPGYALDVLGTDRELSAMMPCAIAVYEGDDGQTYISKMNTGLMGKMFGGNVGRVMGGPVARDEEAILAEVVDGR